MRAAYAFSVAYNSLTFDKTNENFSTENELKRKYSLRRFTDGLINIFSYKNFFRKIFFYSLLTNVRLL